MSNDILKYTWQFLLLCLFQVLIFNNLNLGGYANPFPYIYLIMVLPISIGRVQLLLVSFLLGLTIDVFSDTGGLHAAASTLIAYYRPLYLKAQSPREGYELTAVPHVKTFGITWFIPYSALLIIIHHTALFFLEVFRFSEFFHTILKIMVSSVLTMFFVLLAEYLLVSGTKRR